MYNIGDKVVIKEANSISRKSFGDPTAWTKRKASTAGEIGVIVDKMFSEAESNFLYRIRIGDDTHARAAFYTEEDFEPYREKVSKKEEFVIETEVVENVCMAYMYKVENNIRTEIGRGHGHIIHEGYIGIAQATSYAVKKLYENLNGGNFIKKGDR